MKYKNIIYGIVLVLLLTACGSHQDENEEIMSANDFYRNLAELNLYPKPVNDRVLELLSDSVRFGIYEYNEIQESIAEYCSNDVTGGSELLDLPIKFVLKLFKLFLKVFSFDISLLIHTEYAILNQLDYATNCKLTPRKSLKEIEELQKNPAHTM